MSSVSVLSRNSAGGQLRKACVTLSFGIVLFSALVLVVWFSHKSATNLWAQGGKFPLYIIRSEISVVQMKWLWTLDGLRAVPVPLLGACVSIALAFLFAPERSVHLFGKAGRRPGLYRWIDMVWRRPLPLFMITSALCGLLVVDPKKNALFGDGFRLAESLRDTPFAAAEVGTTALFSLIHWILKWSGISESMETAIRLVSCLCGGLYAVGVSFWARGLKKILMLDTPALLLLSIGGLLSGACVMFFGYIETTQVVAALIAVLFGFLAQFSAASDQREQERFFRWIVAIIGIAVCAHTGAVSLFPLLATATFLAKKRGVDRPVVSILWFAVVPIVIVLAPFYGQGEFGNVAGGGDGILFVPFVHSPPAWPRTDYLVYYSMFSWPHLIDIANAIGATSPLAIFSLATAAFWRRSQNPLPQQYTELLAYAVIATLGCASIVAFWNFDFGMWGDWNLCTAYLLPLHFCAWTVLAVWLKSPRNRAFFSRIPGVVFCQLIGLLGLAYQLW